MADIEVELNGKPETAQPPIRSGSGQPATDRLRVQIEFSPDAYSQLQEMKELSDGGSNAAIVRNALRLFAWFLRQRAEGWKIHLVRGDTVKEVEMIL